jgi:hypothetical protein
MATLKISDLSVGDWVRYRDREWEVCSIYQFTGEVGLFRKDSQICESIEDIDPIPITAEILEKNGWRVIAKEVLGEDYEYHGEERVWEDENYSIDICEAKQGVFWYSWSNEYYMWRLEYVHQLQHLIRLAGVEKEINL